MEGLYSSGSAGGAVLGHKNTKECILNNHSKSRIYFLVFIILCGLHELHTE